MHDHKINIGKHSVLITPLSPSMFLNGDLIPFSFIQSKKKEKTKFEQALDSVGKNSSEKEDPKKITMLLLDTLKHCVLSIDGNKFDIDSFKYDVETIGGEFTLKEAMIIFDKILRLSFKAFLPKNGIPITMSKETAYTYHIISREYGKTPIEILYPNGGYTDMDAMMFNFFVYSIAIEEKNKLIQKHQLQTVSII